MPIQDTPWTNPSQGSPPVDTAVPVDVRDPASLRVLFSQMASSGQQDRAWCAAAALSFVGAAGAADTACFEQHRPSGMLRPSGHLHDDLWRRCLLHPDEDPLISGLLGVITPAAVQLAQTEAATGRPLADPRYRQDPATSAMTMAKVFGWTGAVLGVHVPELYLHADLPTGFVALPRTPLATVAGQQVLTGMQPQELAFACASHLATYRGEHFIRGLFPHPDESAALVLAARAIANPSVSVPPRLEARVQALRTNLASRLTPAQLEALSAHEDLIRGRRSEPDVQRWVRGVEFTQCRAGLLLCGDLTVARAVLVRYPDTNESPSLVEKLHDLVAFSVSEEYSQLRHHLGLAVGAPGGRVGPSPAHPWVQEIYAASGRVPPGSQRTSGTASLLPFLLLGAAGLALLVLVAILVMSAG